MNIDSIVTHVKYRACKEICISGGPRDDQSRMCMGSARHVSSSPCAPHVLSSQNDKLPDVWFTKYDYVGVSLGYTSTSECPRARGRTSRAQQDGFYSIGLFLKCLYVEISA